ncbi:MAG: hypothetical protein GXY61_07440 [Lentisphaerae bacterium]|nr:hypothetical protein [Lentisphaerota bacterium]
MKDKKLSKIVFIAGAVVFSALLGAGAVDLNDALDKMIDLNGTGTVAAEKVADAADDAKSLEMAKLVQAVVNYEIQQGAAALDAVRAAIASGDDAAAKAAMKDLEAALDVAQEALKGRFPKDFESLVERGEIVIPPGVSQETVIVAIDTPVVPATEAGGVNPNAVPWESKGVQSAQGQEAGIFANAQGLITPQVGGQIVPVTGI